MYRRAEAGELDSEHTSAGAETQEINKIYQVVAHQLVSYDASVRDVLLVKVLSIPATHECSGQSPDSPLSCSDV